MKYDDWYIIIESRNVPPQFFKRGCFTPRMLHPRKVHTPDFSHPGLFTPPDVSPPMADFSPRLHYNIFTPQKFHPQFTMFPPNRGGTCQGGKLPPLIIACFFHPCTCLPHKYILLSSCHIHRPRRQLTAQFCFNNYISYLFNILLKNKN